MSFLGKDRRRWAIRLALYLVVVSVFTFAGTVLLAVGTEQTADGYEHSIQTLENTIVLLKWLGGAIITGLVSGIGLLYRALERANNTIRDDLVAGLEKRAALMTTAVETQTKLTGRVDELACKMEKLANTLAKGCPYLKSSEGN